MNYEQFTAIIGEQYSNPRKIRDDVICVDFETQGQRVSVHYFDFSKAIESSNFDIDEYQSSLLSRDYYRDTGTLQWNYYLHFIEPEDKYRDLTESGIAFQIERNNFFARKDILTFKEFEETYGSTRYEEEIKAVPVDPAIRWIDVLRKGDLDGVYLTNPMTDVVKRYMNGNPVKDSNRESMRRHQKSDNDLGKVECITLDSYREYPRIREFKFADATLVNGANGVGKTSLLESIELWCCGQTFRALGKNDQSYRLGIKFDNKAKTIWSTKNSNDVYRERDLAWYGNHNLRGNRLSIGFSRFNLFNSDAAVNLTSKQSVPEEEILQALASLILGESANQIEDRATKIRDLFSNERRQIENSIHYVSRSVSEQKQQLEVIRSSSFGVQNQQTHIDN